MLRALAPLAAAASALALASAALAHTDPRAHGPRASAAGVDSPCPGGSPITPTRVVTGEFSSDLQGSYVMVPFTVPAGTTQVRVKYCHDQPEAPTSAEIRHTLDLGLWDARRGAGSWSEADFRGWGGSSHPDVAVSAQGFSSEAEYEREPEGYVAGRTTRGFRPGPIPQGEWAVELGAGAIASRSLGDLDGKVAWRVEIELRRDPAFTESPYRPARYDSTPARSRPGWYAGDVHVHAEHSSLGDATMTETFAYAFRPLSKGGAGLDFITLSDYVTDTAWGEIGRHQDRHPGRLVVRSSEVVTYRGHFNNHSSLRYVDHRLGRVFVWTDPDGDGTAEPVPVRGTETPADRLPGIRATADGWTQLNHPTIFPSSVPAFALLCRGCPWDWSEQQTGYRSVDAIEVQTGPAGDPTGNLGPSPFTVSALEFWEQALDRGHRIAATGSSDSHHAGRTPNPATQRPIGQATTVVYADELSEDGVERAIRARHTYVKHFGNDGPDLRLEAATARRDPPAIMGDVVRTERTELTARVTGARPDQGQVLVVVRDGEPAQAFPVTAAEQAFTFTGTTGHRYRLELQRNSAIQAVTSPIWIEARAGRADRGIPRGAKAARTAPAWVRLTRKRTRRGTRFTCTAAGYGLTHCTVRAGRHRKRLRLKGGRAGTTLRVSRRAKGSATATGPGGVRVGPDR